MPLIETARGAIFIEDRPMPKPNQPTLVLIHGAGGAHQAWAHSTRHLANANIVALDLNGHGASAGQGHADIPAYADDMIALLDALHIEKAIFAGHSMGGGIALTLALDHPERVHGLILVGTGAMLKVAPAVLEKLPTDRATITAMLVDWFWSENADPAAKSADYDHLMSINLHTFHNDFLACNQFDVRSRLHEIHAPTLIINGTQDKLTPPKFASYLHENIANASLTLIENASHRLPLENAAKFDQLLNDFIAQLT